MSFSLRPTVERVKELLDYNKETGIFTWKVRRGGKANIGTVAGSPDKKGYLLIRIDGKNQKAHRLAWLYVTGEWPEDQIDHIDQDKTNNRIANLRDVPNLINHHNKGNAIGICKIKNKYQAKIVVNNKQIYLGLHDTREAAMAAYLNAKQQFHAPSINKGVFAS